MSKNPFLNALAAILYIVFVASLMFYGTKNAKPEDSILAPIAILSLFSLSAALMGYFLLSKPFLLYLDGKKKEATSLLFQTILAFAAITAGVFILFLSGILS